MAFAAFYSCLLVACVFIMAGSAKFLNRHQFQSTLRILPFVPSWGVGPLSIALPLVEVVAGGMLVSGVALFSSVAAAVIVLLAALFVVVSGWAVTHEHRDVSCACFGPLAPATLGPGVMVRNALLTALALFVLLMTREHSRHGVLNTDLSTIAVASLLVLAMMLLYALTSAIVANQRALRQLVK